MRDLKDFPWQKAAHLVRVTVFALADRHVTLEEAETMAGAALDLGEAIAEWLKG